MPLPTSDFKSSILRVQLVLRLLEDHSNIVLFNKMENGAASPAGHRIEGLTLRYRHNTEDLVDDSSRGTKYVSV